MVNEHGKTLKKDRFDIKGCTTTMKAVVTNGNGGYEQLEYRDVPIPKLDAGEVLLQVLAAGVNNTDINTRLGWYSSAVTAGTEDLTTAEKEEAKAKADGGWNEATPFPLIQGTDCCGRVVAVDALSLWLLVETKAAWACAYWCDHAFALRDLSPWRTSGWRPISMVRSLNSSRSMPGRFSP